MSDPTDHVRIGPTAHYTAYVWKRLGLPYADAFATRRGAVLYWGFFAAGEWTTRLSSRVPSMRQYLEYRHRLIEAVVDEHDPDRLVELGAGLSRRAVSWAADRDIETIDVDLPAMADLKRRTVEADATLFGRVQGRYRVIGADVLADGFVDTLRDLVASAARPVVVAEGLLSYFDPPDRDALVTTVAGALPPGGLFVCDLHTRQGQAQVGSAASMLRLAISAVTRRRRALDPYDSPEALHRAFSRAGFSHVEICDASDFSDREPRLAHLHSPTHVVAARIAEDGAEDVSSAG
jgi:O-methyltransferase involved in polyketide biosynthesis